MLIQHIRKIILEQSKRAQVVQAGWMVGALVTSLLCWLHFLFIQHAGGLWRDEVVSFNVAAQPSLTKLWESFWCDSFPSFFHLVLRAWILLGAGATDHRLRFLGGLMGISIVAAFWINGCFLSYRIPFVSMALVALSPLAIRTTDAIRAYGLGTLCIILTVGLVWRVVEVASPRRVLAATIAAILSVQSLYQNAFLLLAICLGGIVVTLSGRNWKALACILGIGFVAALSLTVNIPAIRRMTEVSVLMPRDVSFQRLVRVFLTALRDGGSFMLWSWVALVLGGSVIAIQRQIPRATVEVDCYRELPRRGLTLFSIMTLVGAVCAFFMWLKLLGLPTQPWYFVPLMAVIAVSLDAIFGTLISSSRSSIARLIFLIAFTPPLVFHAIPSLKIRETNVDVIALQLEKMAGKDDLIIVEPWYCGATFSRYFHGATEWMTLPPLKDQTLQRLDLFKEQMMSANPIAPVLEKIESTLKAGHRVWLVGGLPFLQQGQMPSQLPPAPNSRWRWDHDIYSNVWAIQTAYFVQTHGLRAELVPIKIDQQINPFENLPLVVINGWRSALE